MPKISVIIPLYNKAAAIGNTLESLFAQTFTDFEALIVDDGSTDTSLEVLQQYTDPRIQLFTKANEGVGPTRNFAVHKAATPYIAFLDADDLWEINHLEKLYQLITDFPDAGLYCAAYQKRYTKTLTKPFQSMLLPTLQAGLQKRTHWQGYVEDFFEASLIDCVAWTSAVAMPKAIFETLGGFDTTITHGAGEDTDLWIRAALNYKVAYSNTITATHTLDSDNRISNTPTLKRTYINLDTYEEQAKNNPSLKKFLDLNRYSLVLQHKLAGDAQSAKRYIQKMNPAHLTTKQRLLLKLPASLLRMLKNGQHYLIRKGTYLTPYK